MIFDEIKYGLLLLLLPLLLFRLIYLIRWKLSTIKIFSDDKFQSILFGKYSTKKLIINNILIILAIFFLIIGLMDFLSGFEKTSVKREGIDIVFAIDLSNSMNAKDVVPSRLEKAKIIVSDVLNKLGGDRVGVVIFAGDAFTILPLTNDYQAVKSSLNNLETTLISSQGTHLETAISEASLSLKMQNSASKSIVLLSDGEDNTEGKGNASDIANDNDITVFSIGIGTSKGSPIPETNKGMEIGYVLDDDGNVVISKREDKIITDIANESGGKYIYGDNSTETVNSLFAAFSKLKKNKFGEKQSYNAKHHFQWFLGLALFLLLIFSFLNLKNDFDL